MAAKRKVAAKAAKASRVTCSDQVAEQVAALRERAAGERHGGTALELRVVAIELLLAELVKR